MMLVIFSSLVCVGQVVFSVGLAAKNFPLMVFGRFLFGLGGESLEVAQARIITDWFTGRGVAFALGLNLTFARISTALNDNVSPWVLARVGSPPRVGWLGAAVCTASFAAGLAMVRLDRADSRRAAGVRVASTFSDANSSKLASGVVGDDHVEEDDAEEARETDALLATDDSRGRLLAAGSGRGFAGETHPPMVVVVASDVDSADGYESEEFEEDDERVHLGQALQLGHSIMFLLPTSPVLGMSTIGLAYSLFAAALWPCVPVLVRPHQIATGYGVMSVALNLSLFFFPLGVASARNAGGPGAAGFAAVSVFFCVSAAAALVVSLALVAADRRFNAGLLDSSPAARAARAATVVASATHEESSGAVRSRPQSITIFSAPGTPLAHPTPPARVLTTVDEDDHDGDGDDDVAVDDENAEVALVSKSYAPSDTLSKEVIVS
ncbi:hypothetical protein HK405_014324 [Cladochytrium tenue]|nr:hypothetical protein HK405_014324 [Cladochytrium tenue]